MADVFRPFRPHPFKVLVTRGDALASLRACPWLSYLAPLALGDLLSIVAAWRSDIFVPG